MGDVLVPDAREDQVGLSVLDHFLDLMVVAIVDDDLAVLHVRVHSLVIVERDLFAELVVFLLGHVQVHMRLLVELFIGLQVKLGDVLRIRIALDGRDDLAALIVVPVGELIAGHDHLHPEVMEQVLVVVASRPSDEREGGLTLAGSFYNARAPG